MSGQKRCICGASARFPLCDGKHGTKNWGCLPPAREYPQIIVSGEHYRSLAEWFAHQNQSTYIQNISPVSSVSRVYADELLIINDGTELDTIQYYLESIPHQRETWYHTTTEIPLLAHKNNAVTRHFLLEEPISIKSMENLQPISIQPLPEKHLRIFASHAVLDEPLLQECFQYLEKQYHSTIFCCAYSIEAGIDWHGTILENLQQADQVWAFSSENFTRSTFCAFEIGYAQALGKTILPIQLDTHPIPAYLQQKNAPCVPRKQQQQPWISTKEALLHILIQLLHTAKNS